ncbi:MAG: hypothetical protein LC725_02965, partial [Lentisphaerae bacterium]|nr:hypothetical protein [Lentisphaerota bacterium]
GIIITNTAPVFNVIYGDGSQPSVMRYNGARVRLCFQASPSEHFYMHNVAIMQQSSGTNAVAGTETALTFPGGAVSKLVQKGTTEWTAWADFPLDRQANYLVRFERKHDVSYILGGAVTWTYESATPPMSYINGNPDDRLVLLKEIEVAYPAQGIYRSGIFDTSLASPTYRQINWSQKENIPDGDIDIRVRTGSLPDLSDAVAWLPLGYFQSNIGNTIAALSGGRYVQYEVKFSAASPYNTTAILRDVTIDWEATPGLVDLVSGFARGPDYGIIQAEVNGQLFTKGVEVEMEIFKDGPFGTNQVAGVMEVRPLNTGR